MPRARPADFARHAAGPTMWARVATRIAEHAARQGASRDALLAASALGGVDAADPDARVPLTAVYDLLERAAEATGDRHFGLHFALGVEVTDLDALGYLMMSSATLGVALERMVRYQRLWNDGERFALARDGDAVRFSYTPFGPARPAHRHMAEMAAADFVINGGRMIGASLGVRSIRFAHAAPDDDGELARMFDAPIELGAPITEILLPAEALDRPMPDANAMFGAFFERYADAMLARLPPAHGTAPRVRSLLGDALTGGAPSLPALAARLGMSPRTLQRRLRDEGTSIADQLEQVRRERAAAFLDGGMAIAEIAWLLGYAEPSVFHRAFKRWTGRTPEAWRAEQRKGR